MKLALQLAHAVVGIAVTASLAGCGTPFPTPPTTPPTFTDGLSAQAIFDRGLAAHGGDLRAAADINLSIDTTRWYQVIQVLQPLVTDTAYRIASQERLAPREGRYSIRFSGPAGTKQVIRTRTTVEVYYNGVAETDARKLQAAAMTADAFELFHAGLSFVRWRNAALVRLPDAAEDGASYYRLLATIRPGFGFSDEDQIVLWIDQRTDQLYRVHITLEGFDTTRGAHVDTTFLDYRRVGPFLLPTSFIERVRGPVSVKAHRWVMTGADLDRGWSIENITGPAFSGAAAAPARAF